MPRYRRACVPAGTYFFTLVTARRQPLLTHPEVRAALREGIVQVRASLPFGIDGWVLLPDHLHAVWTLPPGDADFSNRWRLIKRHVTHTCRPGGDSLWQPRFWEHLIRDERDLRQHLDYLHGNPLKHGLVSQVRDWPWSSFHRYVHQGVYPPDWGGAADNGMHAGE